MADKVDPFEKVPKTLSPQEAFDLGLDPALEIYEYVFTAWINPPLYRTLGIATLSATLSFFVTLLGIRGFTLLGIWAVNGFRE